MTRELVVNPLGQITQPNPMGQYPVGALSVAIDVFIRSPGVLEVSKLAGVLANTQASTFTQAMIPSDQELLQIWYDSGATKFNWRWFSAATNATGAMAQLFNNDGRTTWTRSRDRFLVTTINGPIIFDYAVPTSTVQRSPRYAGLPAPTIYTFKETGSANALAAKTHATCFGVIRRIYADGYELVSAVSFPSDSGWDTAATDIRVQANWSNTADSSYIQAGDILEIYRTRSRPTDTFGGTSCDATAYLTTSYSITGTDAVNRSATFLDSVSDTGLGRQLYTNPGLGGGEATRISPPQSNIAVTFKGYSFLFNITEVAQQDLAILGGVGGAAVTDPAAWRSNMIGSRDFGGTTTSGSNVITGVSAADLVGIKPGQVIAGNAAFFNPTTVTAVGASTITMSHVALSSGALSGAYTMDQLTINGVDYYYGLPGSLNQIAHSISLTAPNNALVFQADSLSYFSAVFFNLPNPTEFSIATKRAQAQTGTAANITLAATNGQNYSPPLPEYGSASPLTAYPVVSPNGCAWSEEQEPEAWPPANRGHIGSGTILAAFATRDAIWVSSTDGLWRGSGSGGAVGTEGFDWRWDLIDSTLVIAGPQAGCVLRDTVYMMTNRGFVSIDDDNGINDKLSSGIIGDVLPGMSYSNTDDIQVRADLDKDEVWVCLAGTSRVWSFLTKAWVQSTQLLNRSGATFCYWPVLKSIVMNDDGFGNAVYIPDSYPYYADGIVQFQPLYMEQPFATKQWDSITLSFDPKLGALFPFIAVAFNGTINSPSNFLGSTQPQLNSSDLRCTFMVPRAAPAIAPSIMPAILIRQTSGLSSAPKFWGLSMQATVLIEQSPRRGT